jgi:Uma2 family endonuclease
MVATDDRSRSDRELSVAEPARRLWSLEEFLVFGDGRDTRYELFDGRIVAMAPASDVHGALVMRLGRQIGHALRPRCEVIAEAGIVPPERADSWYEADLAVTCAGVTEHQFITEPILIVEVLSPATAATDRDRKLPDYRTIPSLQDILVVSSTESRIEHFRREPDGWKIHDLRGAGTLRLQTLDLTLDLAELYQGLTPGGVQASARPDLEHFDTAPYKDHRAWRRYVTARSDSETRPAMTVLIIFLATTIVALMLGTAFSFLFPTIDVDPGLAFLLVVFSLLIVFVLRGVWHAVRPDKT